jgi:hypothetical protein
MAKCKVVLDCKLKHTNKELDERLTCQRGAPWCLYLEKAGRPRPTGLGGVLLLLAWFFSSAPILAFLLCDRVLHGVAPPKLSRPLLCLHYLSFHLIDLLWVTSMLLCSHASVIFLQNKAWLHHMLVLCMWFWWKMLEGHPVMHHGACMVRLTRLPPSKHVLMSSNFETKNKLTACNEFKYKFRGV